MVDASRTSDPSRGQAGVFRLVLLLHDEYSSSLIRKWKGERLFSSDPVNRGSPARRFLKTHELADLLANVVLLLRRMPDVECSQLVRQIPGDEFFAPMQSPLPPSALTQAELKKKTVAELRELAKDLHLPFQAKSRKDELIAKILTRSADGYSEQRAIRDI